METKKSIFVDSPDKIPRQEHWAIIEGSSVHHEESGVWAPGHGYPAHNENVITYQAFFNEDEFTRELERKFSSLYCKESTIGIHVSGYYIKKTTVQAIKQP